MNLNEFDNELKYRLFRSVGKILHPTISKRNISDYRIILEESLPEVRVFYPKKISNIQKVMIFIHGKGVVSSCYGEYTNICKKMSLETDRMIIALEYHEDKTEEEQIKEVYTMIKYLYQELEANGIDSNNISLIGDSTGGNILLNMNQIYKEKISKMKEILFYPTINIENRESQESLLNTLMIVGDEDPLKSKILDCYQNEKTSYLEVPSATHGFLKDMDNQTASLIYNEINDFLG